MFQIYKEILSIVLFANTCTILKCQNYKIKCTRNVPPFLKIPYLWKFLVHRLLFPIIFLEIEVFLIQKNYPKLHQCLLRYLLKILYNKMCKVMRKILNLQSNILARDAFIFWVISIFYSVKKALYLVAHIIFLFDKVLIHFPNINK